MIADAEVPVLPNDLIVDMIMNPETTMQVVHNAQKGKEMQSLGNWSRVSTAE